MADHPGAASHVRRFGYMVSPVFEVKEVFGLKMDGPTIVPVVGVAFGCAWGVAGHKRVSILNCAVHYNTHEAGMHISSSFETAPESALSGDDDFPELFV